MNVKLKRIAPLHAGKMLAAFYGLISLVFVPMILFFMAMGSLAARQQGGSAPPFPLMFGMGVGFIIVLPVIYAVMGFIFGVIGAWVYNLLAKWMGGFEFEFEQLAPPVL